MKVGCTNVLCLTSGLLFLQEDHSQGQRWALVNFVKPSVPPGMSVLGSLSDNEAPGSNELPLSLDDSDEIPAPSSEAIAEAADTIVDGDDLLTTILNVDKLPDPIAMILESPPPSKVEPSIITPPSSVGSNHGKVLEFSGPLSYKQPETPPPSIKMTKQECSPIATAKSPVNINSTKGSGTSGSNTKSPRRGRPPKKKPKDDDSVGAGLVEKSTSVNKDTASDKFSNKPVSRQKSTTKSKNISTADTKRKTVTSTSSPGGGRLGRPAQVKSKEYISSSDDSSSSGLSESSSDSSSDDDDVDAEVKGINKLSPSKSPRSNRKILPQPSSTKRTPSPRTSSKSMPTLSPEKRAKSSPLPVPANETPNADSEIDLEEVMNSTSSPYPNVPVLSPLPSRDSSGGRSATPTGAVLHVGKASVTSSKRSDAESQNGVMYVDGKPSVMVSINLAKLDRTRGPPGSDEDADEQQVSAFIKDGKSLLEIKQMPSVVEPLPRSPAPRVHSDSISTSSEFCDDAEIMDSDNDAKSDSKARTSDSNNNNHRKDSGNNHDSDSSDSSSSDEEESKSVSETVAATSESKDGASKERTAAGSPVPSSEKSRKVTTSEQDAVRNDILKRKADSLSGVKIPKKRALSPNTSDQEDAKRTKTDSNANSNHSQRE